MNRIIKSFILILGVLFFVGSCKSPTPPDPNAPTKEQFLMVSELGLYNGKTVLFVFDRTTQQIYQKNTGVVFNITSDNGDKFLRCGFSEKPTPSSNNITVSITMADKTYSLKAESVKSDESKLWLWDESQKIGVVILLQ